MKLTFFRGEEPNFGDELNTLMWKHLVPNGFLDEHEDELFLGIGSIIWDHLPQTAQKHVIGSGYGGYTAPPNVKDGSWNIVWVRGPLTAQTLGLDERLAIADSAILLRTIPLPEPEEGVGIAFMPHFESIARGEWERVCGLAGITFLDPRAEPASLIAKIRGAQLVLTEAMHGAIVADALRTPFIPFVPKHPQHRLKWYDWASSLGLNLDQKNLPNSTIVDLYVSLTGAQGRGRISNLLKTNYFLSPINTYVLNNAADKINEIANTSQPILSSDKLISELTDRCQHTLHEFVKRKSASL